MTAIKPMHSHSALLPRLSKKSGPLCTFATEPSFSSVRGSAVSDLFCLVACFLAMMLKGAVLEIRFKHVFAVKINDVFHGFIGRINDLEQLEVFRVNVAFYG